MKSHCFKIFALLALLFLSPIQGSETAFSETESPSESFAYGRIGAFSFLVIPMGVEAALGYRFRSERWGWGPLANISASSLLDAYSGLPVISLKYEILYYPKSWNEWYWGFMPGVGAGRCTFDNGTKWCFVPTLELVFGKEFEAFNNKKNFYYFSVSPLLIFSFNYGWSF